MGNRITNQSGACTGVLLAGGKSRRMGCDKALLDWQGKPLIEHMMGLLQQAGATSVRVSGERPDYGGIADVQAGGGPIIGLLSVAETLSDGALLVLPVDMPRLPVALLQRLLHAEDARCVRMGEVALPMRLQLDAVSRAALRETAAQSGRERSLRALQQRLAAVSLPMADHEQAALANCNTPDDWQQAMHS